MDIQPRLLPYASLLETRTPEEIDLVVVHCTELPDLKAARDYGERIHYPGSGTGHSGHYYIDRNGVVELWVPENRIAHHVRDFNHRSLGIELINAGRYPDWFHSANQVMRESYPDIQIDALLTLLTGLAERLPALRYIAGHEDLDTGTVPASDNPDLTVQRKRDPGERFPWDQVLSQCGLKRLNAA